MNLWHCSYDSALLNAFVEYITSLHGAKDKAVRFLVCQIASRLMHALPDEAELDDEGFETIQCVGVCKLVEIFFCFFFLLLLSFLFNVLPSVDVHKLTMLH